jgi:hypothetical protein
LVEGAALALACRRCDSATPPSTRIIPVAMPTVSGSRRTAQPNRTATTGE